MSPGGSQLGCNPSSAAHLLRALGELPNLSVPQSPQLYSRFRARTCCRGRYRDGTRQSVHVLRCLSAQDTLTSQAERTGPCFGVRPAIAQLLTLSEPQLSHLQNGHQTLPGVHSRYRSTDRWNSSNVTSLCWVLRIWP